MRTKLNQRTTRTAMCFALLAWVGCSSSPSEPDTSVATIEVSPAAPTLLSIGATVQLTAAAKTASGSAASAGTITWSAVDGSIVSVSPTGEVTALANGATQVQASAGGVTGQATVVVAQEAAEVEAVEGDTQYGVVGLPLDSMIVVRLLDAGGTPVADAGVSFAASGDGSVSVESATTDAMGMASTEWTLGTTAGVQELLAEIDGTSATATMTSTAVAGPAFSLVITEGETQSELPELELPAPLTVFVTDEFGNGLADEMVYFTASGGTLADDSVATDLDGVASTRWTLGAALGAYTASASVDSVATAADFTATAVAFEVAALVESTIVEGDTLTITGAGFAPLAEGNTVTLDGMAATILDGTQSSLRVLVPSYGCVPERSRELRVERGANASAQATEWRPRGVLDLEVGGWASFDSPDDFCLQFLADATGNDEYLVGVTAARELDAEMSLSILAYDGVSEPVLPAPARVARAAGYERVETGEQRLRSWEAKGLPALSSALALAGPSRAPAAAPPAPGSPISVRVPDVTGGVCSDFTTIAATVRVVGTNVAIATDDANPVLGALTALELGSFLSLADGPLFTVANDHLGSPTDVDGNERVLVVVTQEVNRMDIGLGFTTAADLFPVAECASSQEAEIIYLAAPDPLGAVGAPRPKATLLPQLPMELAHEMAHAIQFSRRLGDGLPLLDGWLAEGQARLVREASGFSVLGDVPGSNLGSLRLANPEAALWYGPQFQALAYFFGWDGALGRNPDAPDRCSIFGFGGPATACTGNFGEGAAWALLRYITDRFGGTDPGALHRALMTAGGNARASIEEITGMAFGELLFEWAAALYADGLLGAGVAPELELGSWDLADIFDSFPAAQRLLPESQAFSSFGIARSVLGGGSTYTLIGAAGPRGPLAVRVRNAQDELLGTTLEPRTWVVRVR